MLVSYQISPRTRRNFGLKALSSDFLELLPALLLTGFASASLEVAGFAGLPLADSLAS